jgi:pseudouridine synthase
LDKDTSGLLILSDNGPIIQALIHPSAARTKHYLVELDRTLAPADLEAIRVGVGLTEGVSRMQIIKAQGQCLEIELTTGWNRQIRRTLAALGYRVIKLHRTAIGPIALGSLQPGKWRELNETERQWLQ